MKASAARRPVLAPLVLDSTVAAAQQHLERAILAGTFHPGEALRESRLASELRVSRNSLREALRGLVAAGLVTQHPHRGFAVAVIDPRALRETLEVRCWLEQLAVRQTLPTLRQEVPALRSLARAITRAARRRDAPALFEADFRFHAAVVGVLGNSRLDQLNAALWKELRLALVSHDRAAARAADYAAAHEALLAAFASGTVAEAEAAVARHLADTAARLGISS